MRNEIFTRFQNYNSKFIQTLYKFSLAVLITVAIFSSCKKQSGLGGTSIIQGRLFVAHYNVFTAVDSFYSGKQNVYLIYGSDNYFSDKIESSYDGTFKFPYLKKGKYSIFVYEDCLSGIDCHAGLKAVKMDVEITSNKQVLDVGNFRIVKIY